MNKKSKPSIFRGLLAVVTIPFWFLFFVICLSGVIIPLLTYDLIDKIIKRVTKYENI